ncbi:hyaluronidase-1-like [Pelodytes ibericus]
MERLCRCLWTEWLFLMVLFTATLIYKAQELKQTKLPVIEDKPFISVWNAPTAQCKQRYKVDLDLNVFDIVANPNESFIGSNITIFYHTHLGYYPHITDEGHPVNGGVPQNEDLQKHLRKAEQDINKRIPDEDFQGLGVIDWENWRPLWDRNWGSKTVYKNLSIELVRNSHPDWSDEKLRDKAKEEFQTAGEAFMTETIRLAQNMRPKGLWGYYLFPDCYNHDYKKYPDSYTGRCPEIELKRNDYLQWMWEKSTVLYPSIYLDYTLKSSPNALKFVHHRVKEATRVASMTSKNYNLPIFVYARAFYTSTLLRLTQSDLIHTIGESAALGAAGVVLWGEMLYASTKESCIAVKKYIDGPLGHYIVNVTSAAQICSKVLCKRNGRCVRKNTDSRDYLHLHPNNYKIKKHISSSGHYVTGHHGKEYVKYMKHKFVCQCYEGWMGTSCELPQPHEVKPEKVEWKRTNAHGSRTTVSLSIVVYAMFQISMILLFHA